MPVQITPDKSDFEHSRSIIDDENTTNDKCRSDDKLSRNAFS